MEDPRAELLLDLRQRLVLARARCLLTPVGLKPGGVLLLHRDFHGLDLVLDRLGVPYRPDRRDPIRDHLPAVILPLHRGRIRRLVLENVGVRLSNIGNIAGIAVIHIYTVMYLVQVREERDLIVLPPNPLGGRFWRHRAGRVPPTTTRARRWRGTTPWT